jgi:hypothetical protein
MACDSNVLISLVKQRPSIFDVIHKDHSNRIVQNKLWEEISLEMNVNGKYVKLLYNLFYILYNIIY